MPYKKPEWNVLQHRCHQARHNSNYAAESVLKPQNLKSLLLELISLNYIMCVRKGSF